VLRDRLADTAEQLNFDRALSAAAVAHLGGGAAGPPSDATGYGLADIAPHVFQRTLNPVSY